MPNRKEFTENLVPGDLAQYYEDGHVLEVKVLENSSTKKEFNLKLEVIKESSSAKIGSIFEAFQNRKYAYSGMWKLYPQGTYVKF